MNDFYQENYKTYHNRTFSIDPSPFLEPFVRALLPGMTILDVGCGSGRDILWLKNKGFRPTGFERSSGLATLARKHSGCEVIEGDFETFDFLPFSFDAILASGSLVHIPHETFPDVFANITLALRKKGMPLHGTTCTLCYRGSYIYISLKQGTGTKTDSFGRVFYLWEDKALRTIFNTSGFSVLDTSTSESAVNSKDMWLSYVLIND